jgi:hypothetical protein
MGVDYERQFMSIDESEVASMTREWRKCRRYATARQAFESARRSEERYGLSVAFARCGATYYVWTGRE